MDIKTETTHLGITRATSGEYQLNIDSRIALARRTLYSLIKTGVHGTNGLNPRTSYKIFQTYVLPRLIYGLETLNLLNKDLALLTNFHLNTLKQLQSLPARTATPIVYLLLGALPISAELHKRQLSLLYSIAISDNKSMKQIACRQASTNNPSSFFVKIIDTLSMYELPEFEEIMKGTWTKLTWKCMVKRSINQYWTRKLKDECNQKAPLKLIHLESL